MGPTKVIPMPESIDNGSDWFPFAVLMSIAAVRDGPACPPFVRLGV